MGSESLELQESKVLEVKARTKFWQMLTGLVEEVTKLVKIEVKKES